MTHCIVEMLCVIDVLIDVTNFGVNGRREGPARTQEHTVLVEVETPPTGRIHATNNFIPRQPGLSAAKTG